MHNAFGTVAKDLIKILSISFPPPTPTIQHRHDPSTSSRTRKDIPQNMGPVRPVQIVNLDESGVRDEDLGGGEKEGGEEKGVREGGGERREELE